MVRFRELLDLLLLSGAIAKQIAAQDSALVESTIFLAPRCAECVTERAA